MGKEQVKKIDKLGKTNETIGFFLKKNSQIAVIALIKTLWHLENNVALIDFMLLLPFVAKGIYVHFIIFITYLRSGRITDMELEHPGH